MPTIWPSLPDAHPLRLSRAATPDPSWAATLSDAWRLDDDHRLTAGFRYEMDTWSGDAFVSPRIAYFQALGDKDEMTLASGVYSQSDFPFNQRDANPDLRPEKAFHMNAEWTHHFSKHYRMETQVYQKNYYDLVVPTLKNTGRIDFSGLDLIGIDSAAFDDLDPAIRRILLDRFGEKDLEYTNEGHGKAAGGEVSFFYDPAKFWSGWVSGEVSYSKRRDLPGEKRLRLPLPPALGLQLGQLFPHAQQLRTVHPRPFRRRPALHRLFQSPASRARIRRRRHPVLPGARATPRATCPTAAGTSACPRNSRSSGRPMSSYMEIWNAFNTPNFIMRDQKTARMEVLRRELPHPHFVHGAQLPLVMPSWTDRIDAYCGGAMNPVLKTQRWNVVSCDSGT